MLFDGKFSVGQISISLKLINNFTKMITKHSPQGKKNKSSTHKKVKIQMLKMNSS